MNIIYKKLNTSLTPREKLDSNLPKTPGRSSKIDNNEEDIIRVAKSISNYFPST
jgi:hypothetical protein